SSELAGVCSPLQRAGNGQVLCSGIECWSSCINSPSLLRMWTTALWSPCILFFRREDAQDRLIIIFAGAATELNIRPAFAECIPAIFDFSSRRRMRATMRTQNRFLLEFPLLHVRTGGFTMRAIRTQRQ